jgi:SM-20-related protein
MLGTINLETFLLQLSENGWVILDINPEFAQKLKNRLFELKSENLFKPAALADHLPDQTVRNDLTCWIDEKSVNTTDIELTDSLSKLISELKNYFRLRLTNFETHFAIYPQGHFYKKHTDQKKTDNHRFFSFVIYLNNNWTDSDGGNLCGYNNNQKIFEIKPDIGKMILFKSELVHEVNVSQRERLSLVGWFRT